MKFHFKTVRTALVCALITVVLGCTNDRTSKTNTDDRPGSQAKIKDLVGSELLILELTKELKQLNRDANNLGVPGVFSRELFSDHVSCNEVLAEAGHEKTNDFIEHVSIKPSETLSKLKTDTFQLWPTLFDSAKYFSHAKFYFVSGEFESDERLVFHSNMGFAGIIKRKDFVWQSINAKLKVDWVRSEDSDPGSRKSWKIDKIATVKWESDSARQFMFDECLDETCGVGLAQRMRYSQHFEYMAELVGTGRLSLDKRYGKYFSPGQTVQHPGVCAVDINQDGWDDLYVCDEWSENKLLINNNGKSFYEAASEFGLDLSLPSTSAVFADFDNDGDKDAFVGRCYDQSVLLVNENGSFVDKTSKNILNEIPLLVTSVAANDFNNDGLVDLYLSTYGYASGNQRFKDWVNDFLTPTDQERYQRLLKEQHRFLSAFGPANLLLQNIGGGRFSIAVHNKFIDHNHNTFQSVWVDYDQDGDQDLYVSNDYAQDFLYRNDRDSFVDVTFEVGGEAMLGFGMGAGWGDFDADGDFDLYVSNMYSKAGSRILSQIPEIDKRFNLTANGNRLYEQNDGKLNCLPGTDEHAAKAGWSWGGKFTDFDNDGLLDIYVGSGYLTSPFDDEYIEDL